MLEPEYRMWLLRWKLGLLGVTLLAGLAHGQTAPRIDALFPPGAQRGTRVEVELAAEFLPAPVGLSVAGKGVRAEPGPVRDRFTLNLDADAPLGACEVRIFAPQGGSAPFPFLIGDLPEIVYAEEGPINGPLKLPLTVNGRLHRGRDVHRFPLKLDPSRHLIAAVTCQAFGSPVDPMLRLRDSGGTVVAESFPHRSAESLLVYKAPDAGDYVLEMYDFQLAGSPRHLYRLTLTDGPWLDYAFPPGVPAGAETTVTLYGWNLPEGGRRMEQLVQAGSAGVQPLALPAGANRLSLVVGSHAERVEQEPNDALDTAAPLTLPTTVSGRFDRAEDVDIYQLEAKKGDQLALDVAAAELEFPTDPVLTILNAVGNVLTELDDTKTSRDPSLRYTVPADGVYYVQLRERSGRGGAEFVYRLTVASPQPRLEAHVAAPNFTLQAGETKNLAVQVTRIDGHSGSFEVTAVDLPAGVHVQPQPVPEKSGAVQLPITADEKLGPTAGLARIVVRSTDATSPSEQLAVIRETANAPTGSDFLWVAVSPPVPFKLSTSAEIREAPRLAAFPFPVRVERQEGFEDAIRLVGVEPDRRGTVVPLEGWIPDGADAGTIPLIVQHGTTEGTTHRCRVMGVAEVLAADGSRYPVFHVADGSMSMGCQPGLLTLVIEPLVLNWQPGATCQVQVRLMRSVGMEPVTLRLEIAEATGWTCEPVVVDADAQLATLTLHLPKDADLPPRTTATVYAESSRQELPIYAQGSFRLEQR